jgi:hypothetical protein
VPFGVSPAAFARSVPVPGVGFQIYAWRRDRSTHVEVRTSARVVHPTGEHVVFIEMINHSQHDVAITHISLKPQREGDPFLYIPRPFPTEEPIPLVIAPRRSKAVWVPRETLADELELDQAVEARVSTDDALNFDSDPVVLDRPPS